MPPRSTNDPKHWRDRATRMRALARTMTNPDVAILMADLAADYDKLAERAALKANGKKPSPNGKPRHAKRGYRNAAAGELPRSPLKR
jgi:hypothetical protein